MVRRLLVVPALTLTLALLLAGCSETDGPAADSVEAPELGACRLLTPEDVAAAANCGRPVACSEQHTSQTYAVGPLPSELEEAAYDDPVLGAFAYKTCSKGFMKLLGADESLSMRTLLSWAWFRPSESAWESGARWYRCDLVGGGEGATEFVPLPQKAEGLMSTGVPDDEWMACVNGDSVPGAPRTPCNEKHTWRAVTTIKVGTDQDSYPGDRLVEVRSRDFCDDSVSAWLGYPLTYRFAYTWFHEAEWKTGNRRSICWAWTTT